MVDLYPSSALPDFITNARRELMFSAPTFFFFCEGGGDRRGWAMGSQVKGQGRQAPFGRLRPASRVAGARTLTTFSGAADILLMGLRDDVSRRYFFLYSHRPPTLKMRRPIQA